MRNVLTPTDEARITGKIPLWQDLHDTNNMIALRDEARLEANAFGVRLLRVLVEYLDGVQDDQYEVPLRVLYPEVAQMRRRLKSLAEIIRAYGCTCNYTPPLCMKCQINELIHGVRNVVDEGGE